MINRWLPKDSKVPVLAWTEDIDDATAAQIENCSRIPQTRHVALMPDAHLGYGMPIGGVVATDGIVVPNAVGVDIGCGVTFTEVVGLNVSDLGLGGVKDIMDQVRRDIPVGNGPQAEHVTPYWTWEDPYWTWEDQGEPTLEQHERLGQILERARTQMGTLGGGNHFLELQRDKAGQVYFMIHSGSRSVGKKICDMHNAVAKNLNALWHSSVPDKDLSWLPFQSEEGQDYWADMHLAMSWAEINRERMSAAFEAAITKVMGPGVTFDHVADVHHNYAAFENHHGKNVIVHRKGSVRARDAELVLIPGSMSTASYVARGLGNEDALMSSPHGAGRARSRAATRKMVTKEELQVSLGDVYLTTPGDVRDEASVAYKDIDVVIEASSDLVRPIKVLYPLGVVKG